MRRSSSKAFLAAITVAASLFASSSAMAAVEMFMKIPGIQGESADLTHHNEIDVLAWSWGVSNINLKTPRPCIQDLSFTKYYDSASPSLTMNAVTGVIAPTAVLTVRKPGAMPLEYIVLTMTNVSVTSVSTGGSGGEDRLTENVTLHFATMSGQYTQQAGSETLVFTVGGGSAAACKQK